MAFGNVNVVVIQGNLTRDPELRSIPSGTSVCKMRVAVNDRMKDNSGEWVDRPNYFDVTVWGKQGESVANNLAKGSAVLVQGSLRWREWESDGNKRQAVEINADNVRFIGAKKDKVGGSEGQQSDVPADTTDLDHSAGAPAGDDDIPF